MVAYLIGSALVPSTHGLMKGERFGRENGLQAELYIKQLYFRDLEINLQKNNLTYQPTKLKKSGLFIRRPLNIRLHKEKLSRSLASKQLLNLSKLFLPPKNGSLLPQRRRKPSYSKNIWATFDSH
ncbi:hypothetical protein FGO68_gene15419 [Halteria grandinella]|uniref:Uncharacterized protein n=1 Tax=Halteria grandinella TaxID=5974 RepID=A0A8J8NY19_HALGN|nr:hypothetical protein FGO68_gene15419 [Halteria grandinella]